jgi:hypothetical protein
VSLDNLYKMVFYNEGNAIIIRHNIKEWNGIIVIDRGGEIVWYDT